MSDLVRRAPGAGHPQVRVLRTRVSLLSMGQAVDAIADDVVRRRPGYVCVADMNSTLLASRDPELARAMDGARMTVPDGTPLAWSGRLAGVHGASRVPGPDLLPAMLRACLANGWSSFFYGGDPGVAEDLVANLRTQIGPFAVAGTFPSPYGRAVAGEDEAVLDEIRRTRPHIVWVGLGAPRQELWMARHVSRAGDPVMIGVGGAFFIHAGRVARAPGWMRSAGLEWAFRLAHEPARLWRRYLLGIPRFALASLRRPPHRVREA